MQGTLNVLDASGHRDITFDADLATPEAKAVLDETAQIIRAAVERRSLITAKVDGEHVRVREFTDELLRTAGEITVVPQLVGG
jgi:hypothetical protein